MYNLNKLINLVKSKHNSKTYVVDTTITKNKQQKITETSAFTNEPSNYKTKKFLFLKKKAYRPQPKDSRLINSSNYQSAEVIKLALSVPETLNELTKTISPSTSSSTSSGYFINTSDSTLYKQTGNISINKSIQNSSNNSEIYTLEQMYSDNNIYSELNDMCSENLSSNNNNTSNISHIENISDTDSCSSCSSCYSSESEESEYFSTKGLSKSQISLNKSLISNKSTISRLKSVLIKRNNDIEENENKSISDFFGDCFSIKKLDETIRFKIAALKIIANKLNIQAPSHLPMLETLYDLKINNLKEEIRDSLKQFDKKLQQEQSEKTNNINKFLNSTTKLLKSYGLRRRAKSVEVKDLTESLKKKKSADESNELKRPKHKNYFSLERDNLERKYENKTRSIQFEILNSINSIELQFQEIKRSRNDLTKSHLNELDKTKCKCCSTNNNQNSRNKSKVIYSTQVSLQKRIQNRLNKKKQQLKLMNILSSSSRESLVDIGITNGVKLTCLTDTDKYRNPNSIETMV